MTYKRIMSVLAMILAILIFIAVIHVARLLDNGAFNNKNEGGGEVPGSSQIEPPETTPDQDVFPAVDESEFPENTTPVMSDNVEESEAPQASQPVESPVQPSYNPTVTVTPIPSATSTPSVTVTPKPATTPAPTPTPNQTTTPVATPSPSNKPSTGEQFEEVEGDMGMEDNIFG